MNEDSVAYFSSTSASSYCLSVPLEVYVSKLCSILTLLNTVLYLSGAFSTPCQLPLISYQNRDSPHSSIATLYILSFPSLTNKRWHTFSKLLFPFIFCLLFISMSFTRSCFPGFSGERSVRYGDLSAFGGFAVDIDLLLGEEKKGIL